MDPPDTAPVRATYRGWDGWLAAAVALGIAVRLFHIARSDFPLNDGGLFVMMIEALRANDYVLPGSIRWAQFELPFAYPPFAFYVAAAVSDLTGANAIELLRIVPFIGSAGVVIVFALLARSLLIDRVATVTAVFAFALMPQGFAWSIAGGGLTRAPGQLFALLTLHQLLLLFRHPRTSHAVAATVCAALTVLSHPESAVLLAASALLLTLFYGRTRAGFASAALVGGGTLALTSGWWLVMLSRYGIETFTTAGGNSGGIAAAIAVLASPLSAIPGGPLIGPLFLLGVVVVWLADRQFFLPAWVLAVALLSRSFFVYSAAPIALLAGVGAARALFPGLDAATAPLALRGSPRGSPPSVRRLVATILVMFSLAASLQLSVPTLHRDERDAMAWIAGNTPQNAAFLVLTTRPVGSTVDPTGDWFAALTGRIGLSPPQGTEWLGKYPETEIAYARLQACRARDTTCLEQWAIDERLEFGYVYVPSSVGVVDSEVQSCCREVLRSLIADPDYRLAYDGAGASVFERIDASGQ